MNCPKCGNLLQYKDGDFYQFTMSCMCGYETKCMENQEEYLNNIRKLLTGSDFVFMKKDDSCKHESHNPYYQIELTKKFKTQSEAQKVLKMIKSILLEGQGK